MTNAKVFSVYGSTFALILMAFDRFSYVCRPLLARNWNMKYALITTSLSWLLAALLSSPQLFIFRVQKIDVKNVTVQTCYALWPSKNIEAIYIIYHAMFQFFIPLVFLIFFYSKIILCVSRYYQYATVPCKLPAKEYKMTPNSTNSKLNQNDLSQKANKDRKTISESKIKTFKLTFVIVITFILCGLPFYCSLLLNVFVGETLSQYNFFRIKIICKYYQFIFRRIIDLIKL
jgi:hypothetical protein